MEKVVEKISIVLGKKKRYVFTEEEFINCNLLKKGPRSLTSWNIATWNEDFLYSRVIKPLEPGQGGTDKSRIRALASAYKTLSTIFNALNQKEIDWNTEAQITFYLDDEDSYLTDPYTWKDNFEAECWWMQMTNHPMKDKFAARFLRLSGVKALDTFPSL